MEGLAALCLLVVGCLCWRRLGGKRSKGVDGAPNAHVTPYPALAERRIAENQSSSTEGLMSERGPGFFPTQSDGKLPIQQSSTDTHKSSLAVQSSESTTTLPDPYASDLRVLSHAAAPLAQLEAAPPNGGDPAQGPSPPQTAPSLIGTSSISSTAELQKQITSLRTQIDHVKENQLQQETQLAVSVDDDTRGRGRVDMPVETAMDGMQRMLASMAMLQQEMRELRLQQAQMQVASGLERLPSYSPPGGYEDGL